MYKNRDIRLFSGRSNLKLAEQICSIMGLPLSNVSLTTFINSEIHVNFDENVCGSDVFIIQSLSEPINDNMIELMLMTDAARKASADRITAVIPYYAYGYHDYRLGTQDPIGARLFADLLQTSRVDRILTIDLAYDQIQGFFGIQVDHLHSINLISSYYKQIIGNMENVIVIPTTFRNLGRANKIASVLGAAFGIVKKPDALPYSSSDIKIIGKVTNNIAILVDDAIDDIDELCELAGELLQKGAREIYVCSTHLVLEGYRYDRLMDSHIKELVALDTIIPAEVQGNSKTRILSSAPLFAEAIERIYDDLSMEPLIYDSRQ